MSLHLKYRPKSFIDFVGNEELKASLIKKVEDHNRPHTYLFFGDSGCGKTTAARILAGMLTGEIIEINASDDNGIDTGRAINENLKFKRLDGGNVIFIIDECHRLSKAAMDCLLKPLEEPPEWVYFFLCTTEPDKLLKTILSRCAKYGVVKPSEKEMFSFLKNIVEKENKTIDGGVLRFLLSVVGTAPRDCLTALEKIIDIEDVEKQKNMIDKLVGEKTKVLDLCRLLLSSAEWSKYAEILKGLDSDPESIRLAVLGYMASVLLNSDSPKAAFVIDVFSNNFFSSGKAGLIKACYDVFVG